MRLGNNLILLFGLFLSATQCYANDVTNAENKKGEGIVLEVEKKVDHGGSDKSGSISPVLNGHILAIVFNENIGSVVIEVATIAGVIVDRLFTSTPGDVQTYISTSGFYTFTIIVPNGDEYYGEFEITD